MESPSLLEKLIAELTSDQCRTEFDTMKKQAGLSPEDEAALDRYFEFKIDNLVSSARDVCFEGDESELQRLLPHIWIEFRMEWIRYNTQMQYQTVTRGQADTGLALRGGALSFLLGLVEKFLSNDEIYWCTKLAADPMLQLKSRSAIVQRMVQYASTTSEANLKIVENLVQLKDDLYSQLPDASVVQSAERTIHGVEKLLTDGTALTLQDLHESLESVMTSMLVEFKVPLVLHKSSHSGDILIPAVTVAGLNRLFKDWLQNLTQGSVETSIEERRQAGKSDHLSITWNLIAGTGGRFTLELEEDGLGNSQSIRFNELPEDWGFEQTQTPGQGSRLRVNFKGTELVEMILFSCKGPNEIFSFALPASQVKEILSNSQIQIRQDQIVSYVRVLHEDRIYPLIDMAGLLYNSPASSENSVFIRVDAGEGQGMVIKASSVETLLKDTMKKGPTTLHFIQGYLTRQKRVFSVIDIVKLKEVADGKHAFAKVA